MSLSDGEAWERENPPTLEVKAPASPPALEQLAGRVRVIPPSDRLTDEKLHILLRFGGSEVQAMAHEILDRRRAGDVTHADMLEYAANWIRCHAESPELSLINADDVAEYILEQIKP